MDDPQENRLRNARRMLRHARDLIEAEDISRDDAESVLRDIAEDIGNILVRLEHVITGQDRDHVCQVSTREMGE